MQLLRKDFLSFWSINFIGWFSLYMGTLTMYLAGNSYKGKPIIDFDFAGYSITYIVGFLLSILLRYFYRKVYNRQIIFGKLALVILISTFIFANLWLLFDILASIPLHGLNALLSKISSLYKYLNSILYHSMPLLS